MLRWARQSGNDEEIKYWEAEMAHIKKKEEELANG